MTRRPRQQEMPGTENANEPAPPAELLDQLDEYLATEDEHRSVGKRKSDQRDGLMANMLRAGFDRLPYTDATSGKLKYLVADKTPRPKKISATPAVERGRRGRERDVEVGEEVVESRRVRRSEKHDAVVDPFAATRQAMDTEH